MPLSPPISCGPKSHATGFSNTRGRASAGAGLFCIVCDSREKFGALSGATIILPRSQCQLCSGALFWLLCLSVAENVSFGISLQPVDGRQQRTNGGWETVQRSADRSWVKADKRQSESAFIRVNLRLLLFKYRQDISRRIFEPRDRRAVRTARDATLVSLDVGQVVMLEIESQRVEFVNCCFDVVHGKV